VQQKWNWVHNWTDRCIRYMHAKADPETYYYVVQLLLRKISRCGKIWSFALWLQKSHKRCNYTSYQYRSLIGNGILQLNGTICGCLLLPELPKFAFGTRQIWPLVWHLASVEEYFFLFFEDLKTFFLTDMSNSR